MRKNNARIKDLTKDDLIKLTRRKANGGIALSFYLGMKPEINFRSEANSVLTKKTETVKKDKKYSKSDKKKILAMLNLMKKEINFLRLPSKARTMVFFLKEKSKIMIYRIPVYIPSFFAAEADFCIHPMVKSLEEFPRYLVVAVERDKAEFFSIFLGEIEGEPETMTSDVPKKIRTSSSDDWKGRREQKIERHIDDHLARHFKAVASKIHDYLRKNKFDYLVLGGHREIAVKFQEFLDRESAKKLIGFFSLSHYDHGEIKEKGMAIISEYEKGLEKKIADDLLNNIGNRNKKWTAVAGTDSVIKNILRHNASLLVVGNNYKKAGYICPVCHFISSYLKKCSNCGAKMSKTGDLADEIIGEAIKNKIKIKHFLYSHKNFDRFGIGAFLKGY